MWSLKAVYIYIFYSIAKYIYNKFSELGKYDSYAKMIIFNEIEKYF